MNEICYTKLCSNFAFIKIVNKDNISYLCEDCYKKRNGEDEQNLTPCPFCGTMVKIYSKNNANH